MMQIQYDPEVDMLLIELNANYPYRTDTESVAGLAIMYDENGKICTIEIEDASQIVSFPIAIQTPPEAKVVANFQKFGAAKTSVKLDYTAVESETQRIAS